MKSLRNILVRSLIEFDAIIETMCKDIDSLLERREDLNEKLTCIMEKLDDIEQYSRRNCLLFTGIVEKDDENTDLLIMGIELSLQDIDRPVKPSERQAFGTH